MRSLPRGSMITPRCEAPIGPPGPYLRGLAREVSIVGRRRSAPDRRRHARAGRERTRRRRWLRRWCGGT